MNPETLIFSAVVVVKTETSLKRAFSTSRGKTKKSRNYIILIKAQLGEKEIFGVGESSPRGNLTGDPSKLVPIFFERAVSVLTDLEVSVSDQKTCLSAVHSVIESLKGKAINIYPAGAHHAMRGSLAGVEMAILDVTSQAFGVSIAELLSNDLSSVHISGSTLSIQGDEDEIARKINNQSRAFGVWRVKLSDDTDSAVRLLKQMTAINIRKNINKIMWFDFNEALSPYESRKMIDMISSASAKALIQGHIILEQPVSRDLTADLCALQRYANEKATANLKIDIMADESLHTSEDWGDFSAFGGCNAINIKVQKSGGLLEAMRIADLAYNSGQHIDVYVGGMIGTSGITSWFLYQVARVLKNFRYITTVPHSNRSVLVETTPFSYEGGKPALIKKQVHAGLGTYVDLVALRDIMVRTIPAAANLSIFQKDNSVSNKKKSSRFLIADALSVHGINYNFFTSEYSSSLGMTNKPGVRFKIGYAEVFFSNCLIYFRSNDSDRPRLINGVFGRIFGDKAATSLILRAHGYPAPENYTLQNLAGLSNAEVKGIFIAMQQAFPNGFVVKPARGKHGNGVTLNINTEASFRSALNFASEFGKSIIIENMVKGKVYRFFVVKGQTVAVRVGESETGLSNRHQGAKIVDVTSTIHNSYKEHVERALNHFKNVFVAGVDVIIADQGRPAVVGENANFSIIEINNYPGFLGHHYPDVGIPINVADAIVRGLIAHFSNGENLTGALPAKHIAKRGLVSGRVQGVGYRLWLQAEARARGIVGFVRNRSDGTVEAVLEGPSEAVDDLIAAMHKGPQKASVTSVELQDWTRPLRNGSDFLRYKTVEL